MATRQLANGERDGDPAARFPQALATCWVVRRSAATAQQRQTYLFLRQSQPLLLESSPFAAQLKEHWHLDNMVSACHCLQAGNPANGLACLVYHSYHCHAYSESSHLADSSMCIAQSYAARIDKHGVSSLTCPLLNTFSMLEPLTMCPMSAQCCLPSGSSYITPQPDHQHQQSLMCT